MQQFVVPQFIDVEDKILGPITSRQFMILLVIGIVVFLSFRYGDFAFFIFSLIFFGGGGLIIAFVKVNGQQFHYFLLNIIQTLRRPARRVWHKSLSKRELELSRKYIPTPVEEKIALKPIKRERIQDLSLLVNTGGFYKPEDNID
jgi:hypothetical protein